MLLYTEEKYLIEIDGHVLLLITGLNQPLPQCGTQGGTPDICTPIYVHRKVYAARIVHPNKCTPEKCTLDIRTLYSRKMNT